MEWSGGLPIYKLPKHKSQYLDALRLSQHIHIVNITSVHLLICESRYALKRHPLDFCKK